MGEILSLTACHIEGDINLLKTIKFPVDKNTAKPLHFLLIFNFYFALHERVLIATDHAIVAFS